MFKFVKRLFSKAERDKHEAAREKRAKGNTVKVIELPPVIKKVDKK